MKRSAARQNIEDRSDDKGNKMVRGSRQLIRRTDNISGSPDKQGGDQSLLVLNDEKRFGEIVDKLTQSRETLKETDEQLDRYLNPGEQAERSSSFLASLLPTFILRLLPDQIIDKPAALLKEQPPVIEQVVQRMRENINGVQEVMKDLAASAIEKYKDCEYLDGIIARAKNEDWNAQALQNFIAEQSEIRIHLEIQRLLDGQFNYLSGHEKKRRQKELLKRLVETSKTGKDLMRVVQRVCIAGLDVFDQQMMQFFQCLFVVVPIAKIRKAAKEFVEADASTYQSRVVIATTAKRALDVISVAIEAAQLARQFSIASQEMNDILRAGCLQIEEKSKLLLEEAVIDVDGGETRAAPENNEKARNSRGDGFKKSALPAD